MKKNSILRAMTLGFGMVLACAAGAQAATASADYEESMNSTPAGTSLTFWKKVSRLARDGDVALLAPDTARFQLDGAIYHARLEESEDSDGGDLFDVFVENDRRERVAELHNVPAFGDLLRALRYVEIDE